MRVAVVGAGGAGLVTAWLLKDHHQVTVFEREPRLGGHAHTIAVPDGNASVPIEVGFEFFSERMFPTFCRLLDLLGVPRAHYGLTVTLCSRPEVRTDAGARLLPPIRDGRLRASPRQWQDLVSLALALRRAGRLIAAGDPTACTLEQFVRELPTSERFKRQVFYPLIQAGWCVELDDLKQFSAYNALKYSVVHTPPGVAPFQAAEIVGGTRAYVQALAASLGGATIRTGSPVEAVTRRGEGYIVHTGDGAAVECDHLVLATNAEDAGRLLEPLDSAVPVAAVLREFEYFPTTIAVHGDTRWMPSRRSDWSVVNLRHDRERDRCATTVWKGWRSQRLLFRSWVTFDAELPSPLHARVTYRHPKVTLRHFRAQRSLAPLQGRANIWLAGVHTRDIDCHESAITSAVAIAQRLDPGSPNLHRLGTCADHV